MLKILWAPGRPHEVTFVLSPRVRRNQLWEQGGALLAEGTAKGKGPKMGKSLTCRMSTESWAKESMASSEVGEAHRNRSYRALFVAAGKSLDFILSEMENHWRDLSRGVTRSDFIPPVISLLEEVDGHQSSIFHDCRGGTWVLRAGSQQGFLNHFLCSFPSSTPVFLNLFWI